MPRAFPIGMIFVVTATLLISDACDVICAGVSNTTPFGATETFVGCEEWHGTQRCSTIACARENETVPAAAVPPPPSLGRIATATPAIASAAVTGIAHTVRPACRRLKKCRIHAPITIIATRISHE